MRQVIICSEPEGGYSVECPSLRGCHSQGETKEEALTNIKEAIQLWIEDAQAHDESIPPDTYEMVTLHFP